MNITEKDKLMFLMEQMEKLNISKEDIIGMLSMLETEEMIDQMITYMVNTPNMTEEKVVKALTLTTRVQ